MSLAQSSKEDGFVDVEDWLRPDKGIFPKLVQLVAQLLQGWLFGCGVLRLLHNQTSSSVSGQEMQVGSRVYAATSPHGNTDKEHIPLQP